LPEREIDQRRPLDGHHQRVGEHAAEAGHGRFGILHQAAGGVGEPVLSGDQVAKEIAALAAGLGRSPAVGQVAPCGLKVCGGVAMGRLGRFDLAARLDQSGLERLDVSLAGGAGFIEPRSTIAGGSGGIAGHLDARGRLGDAVRRGFGRRLEPEPVLPPLIERLGGGSERCAGVEGVITGAGRVGSLAAPFDSGTKPPVSTNASATRS
jgi:hypothetical protein